MLRTKRQKLEFSMTRQKSLTTWQNLQWGSINAKKLIDNNNQGEDPDRRIIKRTNRHAIDLTAVLGQRPLTSSYIISQ
jgi:hypothetical protein